MQTSSRPLVIVSVCLWTMSGMEELISSGQYKAAFDLIVQELEDAPDTKEELKELFSFVLSTYW